MSKATLNYGSSADDGTGDTGRAGAIKIQANFDELYALLGGDSLTAAGAASALGLGAEDTPTFTGWRTGTAATDIQLTKTTGPFTFPTLTLLKGNGTAGAVSFANYAAYGGGTDATASCGVWINGDSGGYLSVATGCGYAFSSNAYGAAANLNTIDTAIVRAGAANSLRFAGNASSTATSRVEINKAVTAFTDGVAKATFTVTIPNAQHAATLEVEVTGICGAGGAIGAGEATATNSYKFNIVRTAGVNAVVTASAAFGAAAANIAGATTLTATAAASVVAGAVGATNTFTVDVTITKGGGASDNHEALLYGKLMNDNSSGITIA